MAVPPFHHFLLPMLKLALDGQEHTMSSFYSYVVEYFSLSEEDQNQILPSGGQQVYINRASWARTYLKKAGLIQQSKKGVFSITQEGIKLLKTEPEVITIAMLKKYDSFKEFHSYSSIESVVEEVEQKETPNETIEKNYFRLRDELRDDLLSMIKQYSPKFFEKLVIDLLLAMGYGGGFKDDGIVVGKSHDGGIDGVIKKDRLGLDRVYVQAKRWAGNVGDPEIKHFIGSLSDLGASKGIIITTSDFTQKARQVAEKNGQIVLVNGKELASYMIDYGVGVSIVKTFEIKRVDSDYFDENQ